MAPAKVSVPRKTRDVETAAPGYSGKRQRRALLLAALVLQFSRRRYVPWTYWLAVVLISIVGTLSHDRCQALVS